MALKQMQPRILLKKKKGGRKKAADSPQEEEKRALKRIQGNCRESTRRISYLHWTIRITRQVGAIRGVWIKLMAEELDNVLFERVRVRIAFHSPLKARMRPQQAACRPGRGGSALLFPRCPRAAAHNGQCRNQWTGRNESRRDSTAFQGTYREIFSCTNPYLHICS